MPPLSIGISGILQRCANEYSTPKIFVVWRRSAPPHNKLYAAILIMVMEIQGAKRSPQATVWLPEPIPVSADKARSFPK
jgi:hypothetical protein